MCFRLTLQLPKSALSIKLDIGASLDRLTPIHQRLGLNAALRSCGHGAIATLKLTEPVSPGAKGPVQSQRKAPT